MKRFVVTSFGLLLAISAASPDCWAVDVNFINGGDFNTAANWSDNMLPTADGDLHFIQDGLTSTFNSAGISVSKLVVSDSSPGTLNMTGGDLTIAALGNDTFSIGRSVGGDGLVDLSGTAKLTTGSADSSFVGERDQGCAPCWPECAGDWDRRLACRASRRKCLRRVRRGRLPRRRGHVSALSLCSWGSMTGMAGCGSAAAGR